MANRYFSAVAFTLEKNVVKLFSNVTFSGDGTTPTLTTQTASFAQGTSLNKGIVSVTRNSTGNYTWALGSTVNGSVVADTYPKLLNVSGVFIDGYNNQPPPVGKFYIPQNGNAVTTTGKITLQFEGYGSGTATDPNPGDQLLLEITLSNSNSV